LSTPTRSFEESLSLLLTSEHKDMFITNDGKKLHLTTDAGPDAMNTYRDELIHLLGLNDYLLLATYYTGLYLKLHGKQIAAVEASVESVKASQVNLEAKNAELASAQVAVQAAQAALDISLKAEQGHRRANALALDALLKKNEAEELFDKLSPKLCWQFYKHKRCRCGGQSEQKHHINHGSPGHIPEKIRKEFFEVCDQKVKVDFERAAANKLTKCRNFPNCSFAEKCRFGHF